MFKYFRQIWHSKNLRKRILFTFFIIVAFRFISHITVPGVDKNAIQAIFQQNQLLGTFAALTGGSAENFSIVLMGLSPYINASIIIQLLTVVIPKFESLAKEGDQGRRTINKYTRWLTLPLAFLQSYGMILLLNTQSQIPIISDIGDPKIMLPIMLTVTAGTMLLMWLGELISEKGIGNGTSILIFAGIVAGIPATIGTSLGLAGTDSNRLIALAAVVLLTLVLLVAIILITEGQRRIPITYASHGSSGRGEQASLPIRINQAGMIPIIFAISVISFPTIFAQIFLTNAKSPWLQEIGRWFNVNLQAGSSIYLLSTFILVIAFTYFYVSITFNPDQVAENIQKRGGFIPGIRPGKQTADYLRKVSNHMNLFGGVFIAIISILPQLITNAFTGSSFGSVQEIISGAGMIIIVGVVLDLIRQVNAQLVMHDYDKLY